MKTAEHTSPLVALLEEPQSLATLAVASRVCDHPAACRSEFALARPGEFMSLCHECGAAGQHSCGQDPAWVRPALSELITPALVAAYENLYFGATEMAKSLRVLEKTAHVGGDLACATIDETRALQQMIVALRKAAEEHSRGPAIEGAKRLLTVRIDE